MSRADEDLNWLYGKDDPEPTAVLRPETTQPRSGSSYPPPPPQQPSPARKPDFQSKDQQPPTADGSSGVVPPENPKQPKSKKKRKKRPVLLILLALFLAWLVFLVATPIYAWNTTGRIDATGSGDRPAEQPGTTVLLVGSDGRGDLSVEDQRRLGTGSVGGQRTDTMMLLHQPTQGEPVLLSLPRDSLVDIPDNGSNKLNAAYAFGGAPLLVSTIEQNTGIRIDGYFEVGFLGIVDLVDAVGGIEVCPKFDIDDKDAHLVLTAGCQQVDGVTALGYVRMRKSDPNGDLGRVERQREVISAIVSKVATPLTLVNPVQYWNVNMAAAKSLVRGEDTGLSAAGSVASSLISVMRGKGLSLTVPISNPGADTAVGSAVIWDQEASKEVFAAIAAGDTRALEKLR